MTQPKITVGHAQVAEFIGGDVAIHNEASTLRPIPSRKVAHVNRALSWAWPLIAAMGEAAQATGRGEE